MRGPAVLAFSAWMFVAAGAVAANPVNWEIDATISRDAGSLFWTSPSAIDLGLDGYDYSYEITRVEATVRPFLFDVTVDVTDDIAASFDLTGAGESPTLPAVLLDASLDDATTGTMADVLIEVDGSGFGQASFTNVVLGQADVPVVGLTDIQSIRVQAMITLSGVLPPLVGDLNDDRLVDLTDYGVWAASYGQRVFPRREGDANGDGRVNTADYTVWRDAYAQNAPSVAVPEPAALALALLAVGGLSGRRR